MYEYQYPRPAVTADVVVLSADKKEILLIRRKNDPYKGCWAFPGGFLNIDETLEQCARRELQEETSLVLADIHPVGTYSTVDRDPRGRVITTAYYTSVKKEDVSKSRRRCRGNRLVQPGQPATLGFRPRRNPGRRHLVS